MGYTSIAVKGISWMYAFRVLNRFLSFVKIGVLARVLTPSQFGLFGIASLLLSFLEILTETGINVILIQSKKEIAEYLDSAWVISILRGIIVAAAIIILAPFISAFFASADSLNIILLISLVPFIRGFINPAEVKFQRELNFNYEFWFRTILFFTDAVVSIVTALIFHSVYSLVIGLLAGAMLEVIISFVIIKPVPKFKFRKNDFLEIFHKGKWVTAWSIFSYFGDNGDNIAVGRIMGASSLGVYQLAYKISILPISEIADVVNKVVFPVYSKIDESRYRLLRAFLRTSLLVSIGAIALGTFIYIFPKEIIEIVLGKQWLSAVPVLKILAIYGIVRTILSSSSAVFLSLEKQSYVTTMTLVRSVALIITIVPLVNLYGIVGAGYSALISSLAEVPVILFFLYKIFKK